MLPPPPYPAYSTGSFAQFTLRKRLPVILDKVVARVGADPLWEALREGIATGGPLDATLLEPVSAYWAERIRAAPELAWRNLGFFDLEFCYYRAINGIAARVAPGIDVFAIDRDQALRAAITRLHDRESCRPASLADALDLALFGNEVDLSQLTELAGGDRRMLIDDRAELLTHLGGARSVAIVADNAGSELLADLLLADRLIEEGVEQVVLHLKPEPMFVSDALVADAMASIDALDALPKLGSRPTRLREAHARDRLVLADAPDMAEPRHFDDLTPPLLDQLAACDVVLLKGDLNYRRCFGDRQWPAETAVATASQVPFGPAYALRMCKSEIVVGLAPGIARSLDAQSVSWRTDGRSAMVQRVDRASLQGRVEAPGDGAAPDANRGWLDL